MGLFDLPRGELELLMDGEWRSVMFTDRMTRDTLTDTVNEWSKKHDVAAARYNSHKYKNQIPIIIWER